VLGFRRLSIAVVDGVLPVGNMDGSAVSRDSFYPQA
jgi:hypothetical protein